MVVSALFLMSLSVVLEVYQFARDATVAEAWLMAHEPYLNSQEYGVCLYLSRISTVRSMGYVFIEHLRRHCHLNTWPLPPSGGILIRVRTIVPSYYRIG